MFDCILPIGQTCNISFLLQNAKIKKQTTLFEWFISPTLRDIIKVLIKIGNDMDDDIIKEGKDHVFLGDTIYSGHYKYEEFKLIYKRRRNRLLDTILSSKKILFCRFEANSVIYTQEDIENFISSILMINSNLDDVKLMIITPGLELEHPSLIKVLYDKHMSDPYCESKEINDLFVTSLKNIGYDVKDIIETPIGIRQNLDH